MMESYQRFHNPKWPVLIRKRLKLRQWIETCGKDDFTRDELGLADVVWLMRQIGGVGALIPRTNRFC